MCVVPAERNPSCLATGEIGCSSGFRSVLVSALPRAGSRLFRILLGLSGVFGVLERCRLCRHSEALKPEKSDILVNLTPEVSLHEHQGLAGCDHADD